MDEEIKAELNEWGAEHNSIHFDKQGRPMEMGEWAEKMSDVKYKRVMLTDTFLYTISTVWLGIDHAFGQKEKQIFETMVFSNLSGRDLDCERYPSLERAEHGHNLTVKKYRFSVMPFIKDLFIRQRISIISVFLKLLAKERREKAHKGV